MPEVALREQLHPGNSEHSLASRAMVPGAFFMVIASRDLVELCSAMVYRQYKCNRLLSRDPEYTGSPDQNDSRKGQATAKFKSDEAGGFSW